MNTSDLPASVTSATARVLLSPKERLQRSRQALLEHMTGGNPPVPMTDVAGDADVADGSQLDSIPLSQPPHSGSSPLSAMATAVQVWWKHHPAHAVVSLATPLVHNYAARQPWVLLGVAAAAGAVAVLFKPWRLISFGGMLVALIKSTAAPGVLLSMLTSRLPSTRKTRVPAASSSRYSGQ